MADARNAQYQVYSSRWSALAMFCGINFCNSLLWVTFAPISDMTAKYFGGKIGTEGNVNLLATSYLIAYLPGTIIEVLITKKYNLRTTLLMGGLLTVTGALIRFIASMFRHQLGPGGLYALIMFGQCLAALAQPFFLNMPATIAASWFAPNQRDIATTVGSLFNPLGNALGQVLPVIFVSQDDDDAPVKGMEVLLGVETIICLVALIIVWMWFKSSPPTPPSHSSKIKLNISEKSGIDSFADSFDSLKADTIKLFSDKNYVVLFVAFSVGLGVFNSLMTLINQIVAPHGYSNDDAGTFGAVLIVTGLIGAGVVGVLLEKTRAYRTILKGGFLSCLLSSILLLSLLYKGNFIGVLLAFGVLGFFILPMLPAVLENCAEITFPIQEELSVGLLFVGGNIVGIPLIFVLQYTLGLKPWGVPPFLPSSIFVIALIGLVCVILIFYDGQYKRLTCEQANHMDSKAFLHNDASVAPAPSSSDGRGTHSRTSRDNANVPLLRDTDSNNHRTRNNVDSDAHVSLNSEDSAAVVRVGSVDNSMNMGAPRPSDSWGSPAINRTNRAAGELMNVVGSEKV